MKKFPLIRWISLGLTLCAVSAFSANEATVILVRGKVMKMEDNSTKAVDLALQDKIKPGTTIATGPRSIAKLVFTDNSVMTVAQNSRMKVEPSPASAPGVVSVLNGQIRAKVTKDAINPQSGTQTDKLYIKTKSAAMGIRGTDFMVVYNPQNKVTSLVTFEGAVAMARLDPNKDFAPRPEVMRQELSPERTVTVESGRFSSSVSDQANVSVPVKISPSQFESLQSNQNLLPPENNTSVAAQGSPVPPGVDPRSFASNDQRFESPNGAASASAAGAPPPEGFFDASTGKYAPRAGGFVDVQTGLYIPPPPGSNFDPVTGVYNPPSVMGGFDPSTGAYVPPAGLKLDPNLGFVSAPTAAAAAGIAPGVSPSGAPIASPGAPPTGALNALLNPQTAGQSVSFGGIVNGPMPGGMLPPPPPGFAGNLPPPPRDPSIDDPFCPTCHGDNVNQNIPQFTPIQFSITVQ